VISNCGPPVTLLWRKLLNPLIVAWRGAWTATQTDHFARCLQFGLQPAHDNSDRLEDDEQLQASKTKLFACALNCFKQKQSPVDLLTAGIASVCDHSGELPRISRLPTMTEPTHSCSFHVGVDLKKRDVKSDVPPYVVIWARTCQ
jgi:hypothetical protein